MQYYIPRRVHLPFGYTIVIKQLRKKKWNTEYRHTFNDQAHAETLAFSYPEKHGAVIVLQYARPLQARKEDLIHELQHVMVEYQEYVKTLS